MQYQKNILKLRHDRVKLFKRFLFELRKKGNLLLFKNDYGFVDKTLLQAQNDIIKIVGASSYYNTYKKHELFYWGPGIEWLKSLSGIRNVLDIGAAYGSCLCSQRIFIHL